MGTTLLKKGDAFSDLTVVGLSRVIEIGHKHVMHMYLCECVCGKKIEISQGELVGKHIKSCGCTYKTKNQVLKYDLTDCYFGRLRVINQADTFWSDSGKSRMIRWNCECECGNKVVVNSRALRTGATQSCGCYQKQRVSETLTDDLTDKYFGLLHVIERAGSYHRNNSDSGMAAMWKCKCECGNEIITFGWSLKCGDNVSCGCAKRSQAERYVESILSDYGYIKGNTYFSELTFPDLMSSDGGYLRFDFAIKLDEEYIFIECQGEQHYKSVAYFGGDGAFEHRQANDALKRKWVSEHGYRLIEIPYTVRDRESFLKILAKEHIIELTN